MNRFQKEFKTSNTKVEIDKQKINELFSIISDIDTQKILNFSIENQIPLTVADSKGNSLIHKVLEIEKKSKSEKNILNMIKFLVCNGVGPDTPNLENIKPIHLACQRQLNEIINYLLICKVNVNFQDNYGNTPLHYFLNGKILPYVNYNPIEIIQPNKLDNNISIENVKNIIKFEKFVWDKIKNNPGINFIKNTLLSSTLTDSGFKTRYSNFISRVNSLDNDEKTNESITEIKDSHNDIVNYLNKKWKNFYKIPEIEVHLKNELSWPFDNDLNQRTIIDYFNKSNESDLRVINFKKNDDSPFEVDFSNPKGLLLSYIKNKINKEVSILLEIGKIDSICSNLNYQDYGTRSIKLDFEMKYKVDEQNMFNNISSEIEEYRNISNITNKDKLNIYSYQSNLLQFNTNSFIGGAREIRFKPWDQLMFRNNLQNYLNQIANNDFEYFLSNLSINYERNTPLKTALSVLNLILNDINVQNNPKFILKLLILAFKQLELKEDEEFDVMYGYYYHHNTNLRFAIEKLYLLITGFDLEYISENYIEQVQREILIGPPQIPTIPGDDDRYILEFSDNLQYDLVPMTSEELTQLDRNGISPDITRVGQFPINEIPKYGGNIRPKAVESRQFITRSDDGGITTLTDSSDKTILYDEILVGSIESIIDDINSSINDFELLEENCNLIRLENIIERIRNNTLEEPEGIFSRILNVLRNLYVALIGERNNFNNLVEKFNETGEILEFNLQMDENLNKFTEENYIENLRLFHQNVIDNGSYIDEERNDVNRILDRIIVIINESYQIYNRPPNNNILSNLLEVQGAIVNDGIDIFNRVFNAYKNGTPEQKSDLKIKGFLISTLVSSFKVIFEKKLPDSSRENYLGDVKILNENVDNNNALHNKIDKYIINQYLLSNNTELTSSDFIGEDSYKLIETNLINYCFELFEKINKASTSDKVSKVLEYFTLKFGNVKRSSESYFGDDNLGLITNSMPLEILYIISYAINLRNKSQNNGLIFAQVTRSYFLTTLKNFYVNDPNLLIVHWIYLLLSNLITGNQLLNGIPYSVATGGIGQWTIYLNLLRNFNDKKHQSIVKLAYKLFYNPNYNVSDSDFNWLGQTFVSQKEKLVYAITKYWQSMNSKPLESHLVDTIFIIRDSDFSNDLNKINRRNELLESIHLDVSDFFSDPSSFLKRKITFRSDTNIINFNDICPSKIKILMDLDDNSEKNTNKSFLMNKFFESYSLGLYYLGCFLNEIEFFKSGNRLPKFDKNIIHNNDDERSMIKGGLFYNYYLFDIEDVPIPTQQNKTSNYLKKLFNHLNDNLEIVGINNYNLVRVSSKIGVNNLFINIARQFCKYFNDKFIQYNYQNNINELLNRSDSFTDLFVNFYPELLQLNDLINSYFKVFYNSISINFNIDHYENLKNLDKNEIFNLYKFNQSMNTINSYNFMYYYFKHDGDKMSIPKFFYYKLPINKQNKLIIFDSDDSLDVSETSTDEISNRTVTNIDKLNKNNPEGNLINLDLGYFKSFREKIMKNEKFINPSTIKRYMTLSFNDSLIPPSIEDQFYELYKLIIIELIIEKGIEIVGSFDDEIKESVKELNSSIIQDSNNEKIGNLFLVSKTIESLSKNYFEELIETTANKLYIDEINKNSNINFTEEIDYINNNTKNFTYNFTNNSYSNRLDIGEGDTMFNRIVSNLTSMLPESEIKVRELDLFKLNEDFDKTYDEAGRLTENDFIIYSNDYTSTNLEENLSKVNIDIDILNMLISSGTNLYLPNAENKMPIFKVFNYMNYKLIEEMKESNIGLNFNNKFGYNYNDPYEYISGSLANHTRKIVGELNESEFEYKITKFPKTDIQKLLKPLKKEGLIVLLPETRLENKKIVIKNNPNIKNMFENFTFNGYQEINTLIKSDKQYGYNELRNLKLSYLVDLYLINQFIVDKIFYFDDIFDSNDLLDLLSRYEISNTEDGFNFPIFKYNFSSVPSTNLELSKNEIIDEINEQIIKLKEKIRNITHSINKITEYMNSSNTNLHSSDKLIKERGDKLEMIEELEKLKSRLGSSLGTNFSFNDSRFSDDFEVIDIYERSIITNQQRGPYMEAWKLFFNSIGLNSISAVNDNLDKIDEESNKDFLSDLVQFISKSSCGMSLSDLNNIKSSLNTNLPSDINLLIFKTSTDILRIIKNKEKVPDYIVKFYEKISLSCHEYFENNKYTKDNKTLKVIENILLHLTKNVICSGIEVYTKKAILKYLLQKYPNRKFDYYDTKINNIFENNIETKKSVSKFLYEDISLRLVKNAVYIFNDKQSELSHLNESIEEILSEFMSLIEANPITPIKENDYILRILNRDIINYFSLITNSMISNWYAVCENQMKFVINQYRHIKTYNSVLSSYSV